MIICFNCGKELKGNSRHIVVCAKKIGIGKLEAKKLQIEHKLKKKITKEFMVKHYIEKELSLPDLQNILNISFSEIMSLLEYFDIKKRSHSQGCLKGAEKSRKTLKEKFGVNNVSQIDEVKEKKKITFIKNYGVDNIFKDSTFKENAERVMLEKYGKKSITSAESKHKNLPEERKAELYHNLHLSYMKWFENLTSEQLENKIEKGRNSFRKYWNCLSDNEKKEKLSHLRGFNVSKLEGRVSVILTNLNISHISQFQIGPKIFDFKINNSNILIEVNGDYWHANPNKYSKDDIINYPGKKEILAEDIWMRDKKKSVIAEKKGYNVIKIWENEIKCLDDDTLENLLIERIKKCQK